MFWAIPAAAAVILMETAMRRGWAWGDHWWFYVSLSIAVNYAIYRLLSGPGDWLPSIVVFGFCAAVGRALVLLLVLHEPLSRANIISLVGLLGTILGTFLFARH